MMELEVSLTETVETTETEWQDALTLQVPSDIEKGCYSFGVDGSTMNADTRLRVIRTNGWARTIEQHIIDYPDGHHGDDEVDLVGGEKLVYQFRVGNGDKAEVKGATIYVYLEEPF